MPSETGGERVGKKVKSWPYREARVVYRKGASNLPLTRDLGTERRNQFVG